MTAQDSTRKPALCYACDSEGPEIPGWGDTITAHRIEAHKLLHSMYREVEAACARLLSWWPRRG